MSPSHTSRAYLKKALPVSTIAGALRRQQLRVYQAYARHFPPAPKQRILDLGVSATSDDPASYFFEHNHPFAETITAAGVEPVGGFGLAHPSVNFVQLQRGATLPFDDDEFDIVFCSAVVEHVGDRDSQRRFMHELLRVGKSAFITTPNRWYPVELHTVLPFVHYLPPPVFRRLIRSLGFEFFSHEENLNLLDRRQFSALVPADRHVEMEGLPFLGFTANWLMTVHPR